MEVDEGPVDAEVISQGAEGKVYKIRFLGKDCVVKERLSKKYRVKELDVKINKQRLLQECRCMVKCRKAGVLTPTVYLVDQLSNRLYLEYINGRTLKDFLSANGAPDICSQRNLELARKIGETLGKMHDLDIVHGDLTTSNIMIREEDLAVVIIDFGLGQMNSIIEDKGVDLYVLERAFVSTHPGSEAVVEAILQAYRFACRKGTVVLSKLDQVRMRGRKKDMFG
jgi:TP53 regulating kinase-like protein